MSFSNSNRESMLPVGAESLHTAIVDTHSCKQGCLSKEGGAWGFRRKSGSITRTKGKAVLKT